MNILITPKGRRFNFPFIAHSENEVSRSVRAIVGDKAAGNGIPYYIEVSSWADIASVGEVYETDDFKAICKEG